MNREELLKLAERVEAATGPDRELDVLVAYAKGIIHSGDGHGFYYGRDNDYVLESGYYDHEGNSPELPHFSASIDAAMQLVPEGWHVGQLDEDWKTGKWRCLIAARPSERQRKAFDEGRTIGIQSEKAEAATASLALTAASLRARAIAGEDQHPCTKANAGE